METVYILHENIRIVKNLKSAKWCEKCKDCKKNCQVIVKNVPKHVKLVNIILNM